MLNPGFLQEPGRDINLLTVALLYIGRPAESVQLRPGAHQLSLAFTTHTKQRHRRSSLAKTDWGGGKNHMCGAQCQNMGTVAQGSLQLVWTRSRQPTACLPLRSHTQNRWRLAVQVRASERRAHPFEKGQAALGSVELWTLFRSGPKQRGESSLNKIDDHSFYKRPDQ